MAKAKKQNRKGQALVEYTIILAAVALISLGTISLLGHKTTDMLGTLTAILPGAHTDDNGPIAAGELVPTSATGPNGSITVDLTAPAGAAGQATLDANLFGASSSTDSPLLDETD